MKAQSFFGGTRPKQTGVKPRQVGKSSATPGANSIQSNAQNYRDSDAGGYNLKPPITNHSNGGTGNNHQMLRHGNTAKLKRPNIRGKVDNRRVGQ